MATKKKPREDQPGLDGIADEKNDRVHKAAKQYAKFRDARQAASVVEKTAKNKIIEIMEEEGIETYSYGDVEVCVEHKEGVKVVIGGKPPPKEEGEEGSDE